MEELKNKIKTETYIPINYNLKLMNQIKYGGRNLHKEAFNVT